MRSGRFTQGRISDIFLLRKPLAQNSHLQFRNKLEMKPNLKYALWSTYGVVFQTILSQTHR